MSSFIDLTGQKFGHLTVIERCENHTKTKGARWLCKCDCGNYTEVLSGNLRSGNVTTCRGSGHVNTYDLSGDYGIGYTKKGQEFYFDLEDYPLIKQYSWCMDKDGYVIGHIAGTKGMVKMHRLITNCPNDLFVDHKRPNSTNDNRKENLRFATVSQNGMNRTKSNAKSGYCGVIYVRKSNRWQVNIKINGKRISLGSYKDKDEAIRVRKAAEKEYFGEFAPTYELKGA